jgi:hypothetical protein
MPMGRLDPISYVQCEIARDNPNRPPLGIMTMAFVESLPPNLPIDAVRPFSMARCGVGGSPALRHHDHDTRRITAPQLTH